MSLLAWLGENWPHMIEQIGIVGGLFFTGFGFVRESHVRRGETLLEVTKQHRELWIYYEEHPELAALFEKKRDMVKRPLTEAESRFANFLFLHMRASFGANKAKIHSLPEHLADDWRDILSHPAMSKAWEQVKRFHDRQFAALVDACRPQA